MVKISAPAHKLRVRHYIASTKLICAVYVLKTVLSASKDAGPSISFSKNVSGSTVKKELTFYTTFDPPEVLSNCTFKGTLTREILPLVFFIRARLLTP
jgi:hypothetical protein